MSIFLIDGIGRRSSRNSSHRIDAHGRQCRTQQRNAGIQNNRMNSRTVLKPVKSRASE